MTTEEVIQYVTRLEVERGENLRPFYVERRRWVNRPAEWVVMDCIHLLSKTGEWRYEGCQSDWTEEWYAAMYYDTMEEALMAALKADAEGNNRD